MDKERIFEEIIEAVKNEIPQTLRDHITVETREVIKTNDEKLHGINLRIPGYDAVPTIYLEDFLKDYEKRSLLEVRTLYAKLRENYFPIKFSHYVFIEIVF